MKWEEDVVLHARQKDCAKYIDCLSFPRYRWML
jgi:hypothetical protein